LLIVSGLKMAPETRIQTISLAPITGFAQRLQVANVIAAAPNNRDNVIDLKLNLRSGLSTTQTAEPISF
jgi:hypothetical protein